jgi:hypothetical protein
VRGKRLHSATTEGIDAGIGPDIGPVAPEAAQFDIVAVGISANTEDADEFMLRAVEGALPRVGLVPDHQIQHGVEEFATDVDRTTVMAPIHTDVEDGARR